MLHTRKRVCTTPLHGRDPNLRAQKNPNIRDRDEPKLGVRVGPILRGWMGSANDIDDDVPIHGACVPIRSYPIERFIDAPVLK